MIMKMSRLGAMLATIAAAVISGCGPEPVKGWHETLPGRFVGNLGAFSEELLIKPDYSFEHRVKFEKRLDFKETGTWSPKDAAFEIVLDRFTEFFDPNENRASTNSSYYYSYSFVAFPQKGICKSLRKSLNCDLSLARVEDYDDAY